MGGLLDVERLVDIHLLLVHPDQHRLEITVRDRQVIGMHQHLATGNVDLILQGQGHAERRIGTLQFTVVGDDTFHLRGLPGRQGHHRVSLTHDTTGHLATEATEVLVRTQHILHRVTEIGIIAIQVDRHGLQEIEQRGSLIPRCACALLHHIVAIQRREGDAGDVRNTERCDEMLVVIHDAIERLLVEIHQVHLVHSQYDMLDAQQGDQEGVPTGLRDHARTGIH